LVVALQNPVTCALFVPINPESSQYHSVEAVGAQTMLMVFESFEFVFMLHLLDEKFGHTDFLNQTLKKRDKDIVNAIDMLDLTKQELLNLREDSGWEHFPENVKAFCVKRKLKKFIRMLTISTAFVLIYFWVLLTRNIKSSKIGLMR
jgi:hypothetical protein